MLIFCSCPATLWAKHLLASPPPTNGVCVSLTLIWASTSIIKWICKCSHCSHLVAAVNNDHVQQVTGLLVTQTRALCHMSPDYLRASAIWTNHFGSINSTVGLVSEAAAVLHLSSARHTLCKAGSAHQCMTLLCPRVAHAGDHQACGSHWAPPQPDPGKDLGSFVYDQWQELQCWMHSENQQGHRQWTSHTEHLHAARCSIWDYKEVVWRLNVTHFYVTYCK